MSEYYIEFKDITMSKLANSVAWNFVGLAMIIFGLYFYVNGQKPIIFTLGILLYAYRAMITHTDEYQPKYHKS
jgi:hypothetical protein